MTSGCTEWQLVVAARRIVLTGGPGAGKTVVLEQLQQRGYATGSDAARSIIRERKAAGLSPRPDAVSFGQLILKRELDAYNQVTQTPIFYERGIVDVVGSLHAAGALDASESQQLLRDHPYQAVFILPPWESIYCTDDERDHTFEHAQRVYESTLALYRRSGYEPIEVPCWTPGERATFVLERSEST